MRLAIVAALSLTACASAPPSEVSSTWVAVRPTRDVWLDHEPIELELDRLRLPDVEAGEASIMDLAELGHLVWRREGSQEVYATEQALPRGWPMSPELEHALTDGTVRPFRLALSSVPRGGSWTASLEVPSVVERTVSPGGAVFLRSSGPPRLVAAARVRIVEQPLDLPATTSTELRAGLEAWLARVRDSGECCLGEARADFPDDLAHTLEEAPDEVWAAALRLFALRGALANLVHRRWLHRRDPLLLRAVRLDHLGSPLDDLLFRVATEAYIGTPFADRDEMRALNEPGRVRALAELVASIQDVWAAEDARARR